MNEPMECWSYGGGVQSAAVAVLVKTGKMPQPEHIVIADTGREAQTTWDYMTNVIEPYLGRKITVASHELATVDLLSGNGDILMPMFTGTGKLPTFCSTEWKRRVVHRQLRALGVESCRLWIGISVDEVARAKPSGVGWIEHRFPLLMDFPLRRAECIAIVREAGLADPPRSSCWCCPHRQNDEWNALPLEEFAKAVALEAELREKDADVYLHRDRVPLSQVDLSPERQADLFGECDGYCWT
jgi:hypothetical protein